MQLLVAVSMVAGLLATLVALDILKLPWGGDGVVEVRLEPNPPTEYLDHLSSTQDEELKAACAEGLLIQREGYAAQDREKHKDAIDRFDSALRLADTDEERAALYILRGNSYLQRDELDAAEADYVAARDVALGFESEKERHAARVAAFDNLGLVYQRRGDLERAEQQYRQALEIYQQMDDRLGQAKELGSLGLVYAARGDLDKAEQHLKRALAIDDEIGNPLGQAQDLGSLGLVYAARGDLDSAEEHYMKALEIYQQMDDRLGQAKELGNLGKVYLQQGEPDKAEQFLREALQLYGQVGPLGPGPETVCRALECLR